MPRAVASNNSTMYLNGSMAFNGSSTYAITSTTTPFNTYTFTVGGWVNLIKGLGTTRDIVSRSAGPAFWMLRRESNDVIRFQVWNGSAGHSLYATVPIKNGWNHIIGVCTPTTATLYINGVVAATATVASIDSANFPTGGYNLGQGNLSGGYLQARADDFFFYSKALTATEVTEMVTYGKYPTDNLVLRWKVDDMALAVVTDISGNGNNGTATSYAWNIDKPFGLKYPVIDKKTILSSVANSGYVTIGTGLNAAINTAQAYTVCCSINRSTLGTLQSFFGEANSDKWWFNFLTDESIRVYHSDLTPATVSTASIKTVKDQVEHRLVASYNGSRIRIYVDGYLCIETAVTGTLALNQSLNLLAFAGGNNFLGQAKNYKLWARELTGDEVRLDVQGGEPAGILEAWQMNEGAGTIIYSRSGNNNGTVTSATWSSKRTPRKTVVDNMIPNGGVDFVPTVNVATTTSGRYVDGTATGSSTNQSFAFALFNSGTTSLGFDTSVLYNGKPTLKLSTLAVASQGSFGVSRTTQEYISGPTIVPLLPNTDYTFTGYMKTNYISGDSNNGACLAILLLDYQGNARTTLNSTQVKTTTDWTKYTIQFTTASTDRFLAIDNRLYGHTGAATLIMDTWWAELTLKPTRALYLPIRKSVGENLINNGYNTWVPTFVAATTTSGRWVDGTAAGSTVPTVGKFKHDALNSCSSQYDTTNLTPSGNPSIKISTLGVGAYLECRDHGSTGYASFFGNERGIELKPSTAYTLTFKMKTQLNSGSSASGAYLDMFCHDDNLITATENVSTIVNTTTAWTTYTINFTTTNKQTRGHLEYRLYGHTGAGTLIMDAWFGDVKLVQATPAVRATV